MSIESEVMRKEVISYPKLMESGELVVLFLAASQGTVIAGSMYHPIGHYSKVWDMQVFQNFEGEIKLKNL
jgi:hypothetical protein